jgi:hypothetical protein
MGAMGSCCCGCEIYFDDFNRANADILGIPWCEPVGDWSIVDNEARADVNGAVAILDVQHPVPDGSMVVSVDTIDEVADSNQIYRLMLNVVKVETIIDPETLEIGIEREFECSADDFYFAEFERIGTNTSIIRLGVSSGGIETVLKFDVVLGLTGFTRTFTAILSAKEFCASVTNSVLSYVGTVPSGLFVDGYFCGMALSNIGMLVDNFL